MLDNKSLIRCVVSWDIFTCLLYFDALWAHQNTASAPCKNIPQYYTLNHLIRYLYLNLHKMFLYPTLRSGIQVNARNKYKYFTIFVLILVPPKQA